MPALKRLRKGNGESIYKKKRISVVRKGTIAKVLSSMSEKKYWDYQLTSTDFNSTYPNGLTYSINQIAEGTNYDDRVGKAIKARYIVMDLFCSMDTAAVPTTAVPFTVHVLVDKQANGTNQAYNVPFDLSTITIASLAYKNIGSYDDRFYILKTITGTVDLNAHGPFRQRFFIRIPEELSVVRYAASAATVPLTNNYMVAVAGTAASVGDAFYAFSTRVVYTDN